jgi:hypothetical protein
VPNHKGRSFMGDPQDQAVSGRYMRAPPHVIAGESWAEADIKDPVRTDESGFAGLVDSRKQTKPYQNAKAQDIGFP